MDVQACVSTHTGQGGTENKQTNKQTRDVLKVYGKRTLT